jgi:hypothetical protein
VGALAILFPILAFVSELAQYHGSRTGFSFPSFGNNNSNQLIYMGNASFSPSHGYIDLTLSPNATSGASANQTDQYSQLVNCIGRVLYRKPITVWPATFTTTFTMLVRNITSPGGQKNFNADGLAFIIVPNNKPILPDSYGSFLGVFDPSTDGNATNQLAIEFDTFKNEWDPNDNHVGIDVKSIKSDATAGLSQYGIDIKSGRPIRVRIDYNGWNKTLQVYAAYADRSIPYASILNRTIELSRTVPRSVYLGFSAATGLSYEIQRILDWSFSSDSLPESSLNMDPGDAPISRRDSTNEGLKVSLLVGSITVGLVLSGLSVWFIARTAKKKKRCQDDLRQGAQREDSNYGGPLGRVTVRPAWVLLRTIVCRDKELQRDGTAGNGRLWERLQGNSRRPRRNRGTCSGEENLRFVETGRKGIHLRDQHHRPTSTQKPGAAPGLVSRERRAAARL